jgi:hypothetical protein
MMAESIRLKWPKVAVLILLVIRVFAPSHILGSVEQSFPVLQIGSQMYTNVTVTTKAKTYVFLLHSTGMANIKVADLSPELRETLGYGSSGAGLSKNPGTTAANWAKKEMNKLNISTVQARNLRQESQARFDRLKTVPRTRIYIAIAILILFWLIRCGCHAVICQKAGTDPGILIWIPLFKLIPLLKAAQMSLGWLFLVLIPLGALVLDIVWSFKIAAARGKGALTGLCLILPVLNVFAFFYLVFSDGAPAQKSSRPKARLMSLEAA